VSVVSSGRLAEPDPVTPVRGTLGLPLLLLALASMAVAGYLLGVRMLGAAPACGPVAGCDTVAESSYAIVFGIPVAAWGLGYSAIVALAAFAWWRTADSRALMGAYGLALLGTLGVAYLTYLELFVIHAICIWCVAYAVFVVGTLAVAGLAVRRI
jgi:uncharacterized membrane protein